MEIKTYLSRIVTLLCITIGVPADLFAQSSSSASPNAVSLGNYSSLHNVSYYTGSAVTNFPLYDVQSGGVKLPISLMYNASGVRVSTIASSVGLGWTLNAGGVVTRDLRGYPDDKDDGKFMGVGYNYSGASVESWAPINRDLEQMENTGYEGEPDLYNFTFCGRSGKFIIDKDWNARTIPHQNLKIDVIRTTSGTSHLITGIIITDEAGNKFEFQKVEKTTSATATTIYEVRKIGSTYVRTTRTENSTLEYNSAWHLTKIIASTRHELIFDYEQSEQVFTSSISEVANDCPDQTCTYGTYPLAASEKSFRNVSVTTSTVTAQTLKKINTTFEEIIFNNNITRADLSGGKGLTSISVYRKSDPGYYTNTTDDYLAKRIVFFYDYMGASSSANQKRFYLIEMREYDKNGNFINPYKFSYKDASTMPAYDSKAVDIWGYYNGQTTNATLIPQTYIYMNRSATDGKFSVFLRSEANTGVLPGANRNPSEFYAKVGTLTKITYPDGGHTDYEYELHKFQVPLYGTVTGGGLRLKSASTYDGINPDKKFSKTYDYNNSGKIVSLPVFAYDLGEYGKDTLTCTNINYYRGRVKRYSDPLNGGAAFEIGYTKVTEYLGDNGKSEFEFTMPGTEGELIADNNMFRSPGTNMVKHSSDASDPIKSFCGTPEPAYPTNKYVYPYASLPEYGWARGMLISQKDYNKENALYHEKYNTYTLYTASGIHEVHGIKYVKVANEGVPAGSVARPLNLFLFFKYYHPVGYAKVLSSSTEKTYDLKPGSNNVMVSTANYSYDNPNLLSPTTTRTMNSDGVEYIQKTTFSSQYDVSGVTTANNAEAQALKQLNDDHILNVPVEQLNYLKKPGQTEEVIGGSIFTLKKITSGQVVQAKQYVIELTTSIASGSVVPSRIQPSTTTNKGDFIFSNWYKLRQSFDEYDSYANLVQSSQPGGPANTRIYSRKGALSVANFSDAKRGECSYNGFETGFINTVQPEPYEEDDYWSFTTAGATIYSADAYHGKFSLKAVSPSGYCNAMNKRFFPDNQYGKYVLSCWVKTETGFGANQGVISIHPVVRSSGGGGTPFSSMVSTLFGHTNNAWKYIEVIIDMNTFRASSPTDLDLVCNITNYNSKYVLIDDVQFRPYNSTAEYINYHYAFSQPISETDNGNRSIYMEYDSYGRPLKTLDNEKNLLTYMEYYQKDINNAADKSYVKTYKTVAAGVPHATLNDVKNHVNVRQNVVYMDGLGRTIQNIAVAASPANNDIIVPVEYDHLGRQIKNYLPFATTDLKTPGSYRDNVFGIMGQQSMFYRKGQRIARGTNPWYENRYESSMMSRLLERSAPGFEWRKEFGHTQLFYYRTNTCGDDILFWQYNYTTKQWESTQTYPAGTLQVDEIRDQNYHWTIMFKDKLGRPICIYSQKKDFKDETTKEKPLPFDYKYYTVTYTIYNELGQQVINISPEGMQKLAESGSFALTQSFINKWANTFVYDKQGRMKAKNAGKEGEELFVFDKYGRIIMSRSNVLSPGIWNFSKYDEAGRIIITGTYNCGNTNNSTAQAALQTSADASAIVFERASNANFSDQQGYTNSAFPVITDFTTILGVTYYDHYDFDYDGSPDVTIPSGAVNEKRGVITGNKQRKILPDGSIDQAWLQGERFYDDKGRVFETHMDNHLGGEDISKTTYDFSNNTVQAESQHITSTQNITIIEEYEYDRMQRPLNIYHTINGGVRILLSNLKYNELGVPYEKNLHSEDNGNTYLQSVDYSYDAQGHLTHINNFDLSNDLKPKSLEVYPGDLHIGAQATVNKFSFNNGAIEPGKLPVYAAETGTKIQDHIRLELYNNGGPFDITNQPEKTAKIIADKWIGSLQGFYGGDHAVMELALVSQLPCGINYYSNRQNAPIELDPKFPATDILRNDIIKKLLDQFPSINPSDRNMFNQIVQSVLFTIKQNYNLPFNIPDQDYLLPPPNDMYMQCSMLLSDQYSSELSYFILAGFQNYQDGGDLIGRNVYNEIMQGRIQGFGYYCNITIPESLYILPDIKYENDAAIISIAKETAVSFTRMLEEKGYGEDDFATFNFQGYNLAEAKLDPEYNERPYTTQFTYEAKFSVEKDLISFASGSSGILEEDFRGTIEGSLTAYMKASGTSSFGTDPLIYNDDDNDLWGLQLNYASLGSATTQYAQYNGNVSQALWKMIGEKVNVYTYGYDALSRITKAEYYRMKSTYVREMVGAFDVNQVKYDNNGNILLMQRNGAIGVNPSTGSPLFGAMDNLNYYYEGNKLLAVEDIINNSAVQPGALHFADDANANPFKDADPSTYDYLYSANGSMITDRNRGIDNIKYNLLNLPGTITFTNGDKIEITYLPDGTKLTQVVTLSGSVNQTDYVEDMVYENNNLKYVFHEEGKIVYNGGNFDYQYDIKDQIGSVRLTFGKGGNALAMVIQHDAFYPFGMRLGAINYVAGMESPYMFNGKEWVMQGGLNMYDYGWRMYDPTIGRWHCPDPLDQQWSQYVFCGNNPIVHVDGDGRWFGLDDLIVAAVGAVVGYVSYGIATGNWGKKAFVAAAIGAAVGLIVWNTFGVGAAAAKAVAVTGTVHSAWGGAATAVFGTKAGFLFVSQYAGFTFANCYNHRAEMKAADEKGWDAVWAFTGFAVGAGLSAGMNPTFAQPFKITKYKLIGGLKTFAGVVITNNLTDNFKDGDLSLRQLHIGPIGYNFEKGSMYTIFSPGLSTEQRLGMGFETILGLACIDKAMGGKLYHKNIVKSGKTGWKLWRIDLTPIGDYARKTIKFGDTAMLLYKGKTLFDCWYYYVFFNEASETFRNAR
jgi:RHS repeat-associated protein